MDVNLPMLNSILVSNQHQIERAVEMVLRAGRKRVGVLGLSFKPNTDDLREALGAFPEAAPDEITGLDARIETVEKRLAAVAVEVSRAKTLWPVALRSLEARLDGVAPKRAAEQEAEATEAHAGEPQEHEPDETTDDLLAGLRDSLQAMETVAAELERSTETTPDADPTVPAAEQAQAVAAKEARAAGLHWTFGPMLDITRDARWGRIVEGAGEDPFLGAAMAAAQVRGFQGPHLGAPERVIACAARIPLLLAPSCRASPTSLPCWEPCSLPSLLPPLLPEKLRSAPRQSQPAISHPISHSKTRTASSARCRRS